MHGQTRNVDIEAIPGSPPDLRRLPPGCSFAPRCRHAVADCTTAVPAPVAVGPGHVAACIRAEALARQRLEAAMA